MKDAHVSVSAIWHGGKLHLNEPSYLQQLAAMKLGEGEECEVRIERAVEAKRIKQVRLWFALVREISDYTGYDVVEVHELAKVAVREPDWPTSLSRFSKDEMSKAIDGLLRWSAETVGLVLQTEAA